MTHSPSDPRSDLDTMSTADLKTEIRAHRESPAHDLGWYHHELRNLRPEKTDPAAAVPPWPNSGGAASNPAPLSTAS